MAKGKQVLGRGLGALLGANQIDQPVDQKAITADDGNSVNVISMIEIARIQANPFQPRRHFDAERLQELANSIRRSGVTTAITVRRFGDGFQLISGERRVRASIEADRTEIPALILDVKSDREMMELSLVENIQREDLNPIEIAQSYQQLLSLFDLTQEELAESVGKDRSTVTNFIRLLKLPDQIQGSLRDNEITMGHARALLSIGEEERRLDIWRRIRDEGLSVRRTEALVKEIAQTGKGGAGRGRSGVDGESRGQGSGEPEHTLADVSARLRHILGTQVRVRGHASGEGAIVIDYYSHEDLERLLELFAIIEQNNR